MIRKKKGSLEWLEFEILQGKALKHAVFLRRGGFSEGVFKGLNLSSTCGDDLTHVVKNKERIKDFFSKSPLILGKQVHGEHIEVVDEVFIPGTNCDGLMTTVKNQALTILHADCQAAIFYDPIQHRVANIHCGWRGNVQNIYQKTIKKFEEFGSNPSDLLVCISPSLGPNKAEFIHYKEEFPESFQEFMHKDCLFNLWEISRRQLLSSGILPNHIEMAQICTYEEEEDFYSYRRNNITGRNGTIVELL